MELILQRLRSKTYLVAILLAVLGVVQAYIPLFHLNDRQAGWTAFGLAVLIAVLREVTSIPLNEK